MTALKMTGDRNDQKGHICIFFPSSCIPARVSYPFPITHSIKKRCAPILYPRMSESTYQGP